MQLILSNFDPIYFHLIAFFVNFVALIVIYLYGIKLYKTEKKLKARENKLAYETQAIVYDANKKAAELISASKNITVDLEKQYKKAFDTTLESAQKEYLTFFAKLDEFHKAQLAEFLIQLKQKNVKMTDEYDGYMKKAIQDNLDSVKDQIAKTLLDAQSKINEYRDKKITEIHNELGEKLYKQVKQQLPGYLTPEQSMQIVTDAIDLFIKENKNVI